MHLPRDPDAGTCHLESWMLIDVRYHLACSNYALMYSYEVHMYATRDAMCHHLTFDLVVVLVNNLQGG